MADTLTDSAPRRSLWRHRDFLLLWGGQSVSEIGSAVTALALPLAAVVLPNASTFQVGLLTAMSTVPFLRKVVACTGTSNLFNSMLMAVEMPFMVRVLHLKPSGVGLVLTLAAVGGMVGGVVAGPLARRFGSARIIWLSPLVLGIPAFLAPLATPGWGVLLYAAGLAGFGMMAVVYNVAQVSYRQAITPHALLGRMNASVRFIVWGTMPVGALLGGLVGTWFGLRATLWIAVVGSYTAVAWVFFSPLRHLRDVPVATPDPA